MGGRSQAQQLADQFAKTVGLPSLTFDQDGTLILQFQTELAVFLGIDQTETFLTFLISLTGSAGPKSAAFLGQLLQANFLWAETDGATIGIDGQGGPVTLQKRLRISDLNYPSFEVELNGFVDVALAWTRKVQLAIVLDKAHGGVPLADHEDSEPMPDESASWMRA